MLDELTALAASNTALVPMLGLGYHGTITPPVIRRNVLEDPAWYTAYTPYQPEIAQGTLQMLFEFQTQVARLYGCEVANASMYDGSTACWEAVAMAARITFSSSPSANTGFGWFARQAAHKKFNTSAPTAKHKHT